jgi:protein TonB
MSTDDSRKPRTDMNDEKYESTVLDFLDKEIAAAQPLQDQTSQADDLDALVSDLMKQVITESNQLQESPEVPDQLISGPPPEQSKAVREAVHESREKAPVTPAAASAAPKKSKPGGAAEKPLVVPAPILSKPHPKPRWMIPAIAFAFLCLLASIGVVIHYSGSPGKAPAPQPVSTSPAVSVPAPAVTQAKPQTVAPAAPVQQTPAPVSNQSEPAVSSPKPQQAEEKPVPVQKPVTPAKTTEISVPPPIPAVPNKSAESKAGPAEKLRPENPPAAIVSANVAPAEPPMAERAPVTVPAPAIPETTSLISANAVRAPEKPLTPISSQVESSAAPLVPASSNARRMIPSTPISQASPSYPELAMRTGASGSVVLDLDIDAQGKVVKATPVSGPSIFFGAAVSAALKWRYKPASIGGTNVASRSRVTMVFNMKK